MAALVIHTAALELTEQVEEAVFIGGVPAQLLHGGNGKCKTAVSVFSLWPAIQTLTLFLNAE